MTAQTKAVIKSYFEQGDFPTQAQFADLVDSYADTGSGGSVSGPGSSVDSQIALFSGTSGIVLKASTTTGLLKATSGVLAAASSGSDYAPPSSGTGFQKGNGSGGFTGQTSVNLSDLATQGGNTLVANATGGSASPTAISVTSDLVLSTTLGVNVGTGANQIVKLDGSSKLPAVDGSQLTNLPSVVTTATPTSVGVGTSLTLTVDFTTYSNYRLIFTNVTNVQSPMVVNASSNAGGAYTAFSFKGFQVASTTLTNITALPAPANADLIMDITQSQTTGTITMTIHGAVDTSSIKTISISGDSALSAACNRIQFDGSTQVFSSGFYTLIPTAKR